MTELTNYLNNLAQCFFDTGQQLPVFNTPALLEYFTLTSVPIADSAVLSWVSLGVFAGLCFLTTLFSETKEYTHVNPFKKGQTEVQQLREVLERRDRQLEEANATIERQSFLLKKYGLESCGGLCDNVEKLEKLFNSVLLTENSWSEFKKIFDSVHYGFLTSLKLRYNDLTEGERRLAVLIKLNISNKDMARMLGISPNSIIKSRYRLKKKICQGFPNKSLEELVMEI